MLFIGIDPGLTGACAFVEEGRVNVVDTPVMVVQAGKKNRSEFVPAAMAEILLAYLTKESFAVMEKVGSMPEQGIASAFSFGRGYGMWEGILAAFKIPYTLVHPVRWKKAMLPDMGKDKDASRLVVSRLFPASHALVARKKDHGRADAILLAEYARRSYTELRGVTPVGETGMLPLTR